MHDISLRIRRKGWTVTSFCKYASISKGTYQYWAKDNRFKVRLELMVDGLDNRTHKTMARLCYGVDFHD